VDGWPAPQIALTALVSFLVIRLNGPGVWWAAVLVGHVGSALLAYAIVGVAIVLGSSGAEAAADDPDFGISCVLGASLGALYASGWRVVGAIGFVLMLPFSIDWYGPEHPLSFVLGAVVVAGAGRLRRRRPIGAAAGGGRVAPADEPGLR
jgi:MYXO-CTERM domain-containing protein